MPRALPRPRSRAQAELVMGCQPGSVMAGMSTKRQREFKTWLKQKNSDSRAYERQLAGGDRRRSPYEP